MLLLKGEIAFTPSLPISFFPIPNMGLAAALALAGLWSSFSLLILFAKKLFRVFI